MPEGEPMPKRYIVEYDGLAYLILDTHVDDGDNCLVDGVFSRSEAEDLCAQWNDGYILDTRQLNNSVDPID